jgi:hypothetical protein
MAAAAPGLRPDPSFLRAATGARPRYGSPAGSWMASGGRASRDPAPGLKLPPREPGARAHRSSEGPGSAGRVGEPRVGGRRATRTAPAGAAPEPGWEEDEPPQAAPGEGGGR